MAVIHVLDKHTAELIAAGEVVERPASVVKELLENSIDAGATQVTVSIESGGVKLIEISDNGTGIDAEYIPTAFIRHATSKIEKPDDLNSIHTLGFRGEALASIASVARVELLTRTEVDEFATCYRIAGGEEQGREPAARAVGTTIRVQDLFYNTPARMKFMKSDAAESSAVFSVVQQQALAHPEISFRFLKDGQEQLHTDGSHPRCEVTDEFLSLLAVLVDGAFVDELKDISLRFRGSSNQRIIDVPKTLQSGTLTLWDERANI